MLKYFFFVAVVVAIMSNLKHIIFMYGIKNTYTSGYNVAGIIGSDIKSDLGGSILYFSLLFFAEL